MGHSAIQVVAQRALARGRITAHSLQQDLRTLAHLACAAVLRFHGNSLSSLAFAADAGAHARVCHRLYCPWHVHTPLVVEVHLRACIAADVQRSVLSNRQELSAPPRFAVRELRSERRSTT